MAVVWLLFPAAFACAAQPTRHHELEVEILPDTKSLRGTDTIRFPGGMPRIRVALRPGVRILDVARSADWVWACWMNQGANHGTFATYDGAELSNPGVPIINNAGGAVGLTDAGAWLQGALMWTGGAPTPRSTAETADEP